MTFPMIFKERSDPFTFELPPGSYDVIVHCPNWRGEVVTLEGPDASLTWKADETHSLTTDGGTFTARMPHNRSVALTVQHNAP